MEDKTMAARNVYDLLCQMLDAGEWKYEKIEEELIVHFKMAGEDLPMNFLLLVDEKRQLIRLSSLIPFKVPEDKRMEAAIMTCAASENLVDGSFDYDIGDGTISFRQTASFLESTISEELFAYMIACSYTTVEEYNDQFFAVCKGFMELEEFLAKL